MIPKRFHFYYDAQVPFGIMHYAALKSCLLTQSPESVTVWAALPMSGMWWDKIKAEVIVTPVLAPITEPRAFIDSLGGGIWATFTNVFLRPLDLSKPFQSTNHRGCLTTNVIGSSGFLDVLAPRWLLTDPYIHDDDDWDNLIHRLKIDIQPESEVLTFETSVLMSDVNDIFEYDSTYACAVQHLFEPPTFPELTVIYPVRVDSIERVENALTNIHDMCRRISPPHIIVVEYGPNPTLQHLVTKYATVQYIFVLETPDVVWAKGLLVNTVIPWLRTKYMAVWDVDAFIPLGQVGAAYRRLTSDAADVVMPFNLVHMVRRTALALFRNGRINFRQITSTMVVTTYNLEGNAYGCCVLIRTALFKHVRGFSDILRGWGWEDVEIKHRLLAVGARETFLPGACFHINHPRPSTSRAQPLDASRNMYETSRVQGMPVPERLTYLGITATPGEASTLLSPKDPPQPMAPDPNDYSNVVLTHRLLADYE